MEKILLTEIIIKDILSFIPEKGFFTDDVSQNIYNLRYESYAKQLRGKTIYSKILNSLKESLKVNFYSSLISPGENVGIICAQSIGERLTQTTLNTFHHVGESNKIMNTGIKRVTELLNATKDPVIINHEIFFNRDYESVDMLRLETTKLIQQVMFSKIIESIKLLHNFKFIKIIKLFHNVDLDDNWLELKIKVDMLYQYQLTLEELVGLIPYTSVIGPFQCGIIFINAGISDLSDYEKMKKIDCEIIPILNKIYISGINYIDEVYYTKSKTCETTCLMSNKAPGSKDIEKKHCALIFREILALPMVDSYKTISNNIWDIYVILGIEACKQFLLNQFKEIMEGINQCHMELLIEQMCHTGTINSISRYTLRTEKVGVLSKSSFEEILINFLKSSSKGEEDECKSISSAIILGKRVKNGSTMCELLLQN